MTDSPHSAELIPFDQVRRIVHERRRLASPGALDALAPPTSGSTSQVRRILSEQRAAARSDDGPGRPT